MKILLKAYTQLNVGDDLFIDLICRRYPDVQFMLAAQTNIKYERFISEHPNLTAFCGHTLLYKALRRMGCTPLIEKSILSRFDAVVHIGGSIFMENEDNRYLERVMAEETTYCSKKKIPYHIISCNFGPYMTEGYRKRMSDCFARCSEVCFRDTASYELFRGIAATRLAPDAAFSCALEKPEIRENVLGVVPISYKDRAQSEEYGRQYIKILAEQVKKQLEEGGSAEIFCFCAFEGDCEAAQSIVNELEGCEGAERVSVRVYDGGLAEFLKAYLSCGKIIASRFHAIILALMYKIPLMMHIYSKKTENVLRDMQIYDEIEFDEFKLYALPTRYVENSQKTWEKIDELYKKF